MLRTYIADKVTATLAVQALLAGLMSRHRSGRGSRIEVSMLEAVSYFNFPDVLESRTVLDGALPLPQPPADCIVATADGYLALAPVSGAQVRATLGALGHPEWMDEITRHAAFAQFAPVLMERIETITRTAPTTHWLRVFGDIDVPAAAVQDLDGHLADPQVAHLDIYWTCEHATLGPMRYARYPARFDGQRADGGSGSKPFPRPGEHNDELRGGVPALPAG
jgi:crotonobetainyl-CoA:carnitine CoA-transferase CaiB-like acyl-CoA transferase